MKPDSKIYRTYVKIPERELVCAEVCTEPVAPACCAAKARSEPGRLQKTRPYSCREITVPAGGILFLQKP